MFSFSRPRPYPLFLLILLFTLAACRQVEHIPTSTPVILTPMVMEIAAATYTPSPTPTFTPTSSPLLPLPTPLPTLTPSLTPEPSPTPNPYRPYMIETLANRTYGGGEIEVVEVVAENESYKQYIITYPSDNLTIYGYMTVPAEGDSFPVAIVVHGYIPPNEYETITYTRRYVEALVEAGYFVFHPNLRDFPPSDSGNNFFRVGAAIDLLNLIAIIKEQSQDPHGILRRAQGEYIHLMGHSMGGGVALRAVTVWPDAVRALVLYGSMSGDEALNYQQIQQWSGGVSGVFELRADAAMMQAISPIYHLDRLEVPISIHHSRDDQIVPYTWSEALCQALQAINHPVECFTYVGVPHTFQGSADTLFMERMIAFFRRY